jgi:uncharacterized iron-regulated membrane protein
MPARICLKSKTKPSVNKWRAVWLAFHLYLGLSVGFVFVLAGITGSLLVFYVELDEVINPQLQIAEQHSKEAPQTYEALYQSLRASHPDRYGFWRLEMPRHDQAMVMARYYKPKETEHLHFAPLIAWINPYTAEIVSNRFWGETVITWIFDLHYALLLDETGKTIMGIIGLVLLIPLLSGLYLWWPAPGKLKSALMVKSRSSKARLIFDLHKTNGIYSLSVLLIVLISGAILELPDVFKPLVNTLSPLYKTPSTQSVINPQLPRISLDKAVKVARTQFPEAVLRWIETPNSSEDTYKVFLYQDGEPSKRFPKTIVWIDQYTGKIVAIRNAKNDSAGETFIKWLHPLHNGEIAGLPGRIIIFASGIIPLILYVTGVIRWLQKRKARLSRPIRRHAHPNDSEETLTAPGK